jgi:hypothetical protein
MREHARPGLPGGVPGQGVPGGAPGQGQAGIYSDGNQRFFI